MIKPRNVFIGAACTHIPLPMFDEYKKTIEAIADFMTKLFGVKARYALEDSDPYLPNYHKERSPFECYRMDRELVERSQLMIAEVSFPSTGLGQELQIAAYNNIPVVLCYRNWGINHAARKDYTTCNGERHTIELGNRIVSVMVEGNPSVVHEICYADAEDCIRKLEKYLRLFNQFSPSPRIEVSSLSGKVGNGPKLSSYFQE